MWLGAIKGQHNKWSKREIIGISSFLTKCNNTLPFEIHRSIRALDSIKYWKATEFRTFLLYVGIVALKNRISQREYEMFLLLFSAVTICSSNAYANYLSLARNLFTDFIEQHIEIFGEGSITINIHNTSHVVDDVERFGPLNSISAYEFENHLHHLKIKLKQCNRPLQQIARRIIEGTSSKPKSFLIRGQKFPLLKHQFILPDETLGYRCIEFKPNAMLSSTKGNEKNKWFFTHTNDIVEFKYFAKNKIYAAALKHVQNFFQKPFESKYLNIFLSDGEKCDPKYFEFAEIKGKMFCLPHEDKFIFIPLLHTLG